MKHPHRSPQPDELTPALPRLFGRQFARLLIATLLALSLGACQKVAFYEKQHLASSLMQFDSNPTLDNLLQKVFYSREATTGGIGSGAGGGCGCTN